MVIRTETTRQNLARLALERCRPHFVAAAVFSAVSNLLLLTPSIYMLQVYDRVVPTGGLVTLAAISVVALVALATLSVLDWLRSRILIRAGARFDLELAGPTLRLIMSSPSLSRLSRGGAMRNLDTLRQAISSPATSAMFDAPWAPIYIIVAFLLHPALGLLTLVASLVLLGLAWDNERRMRAPVRIAGEAAAAAYSHQEHISAYAAEVRALGLAGPLGLRQLRDRAGVARLQSQASFIGGNHSGLLRFLRLTLQSGALALGAVLVADGSVSGGAVFAGSMLMSRALSPIEQIVGAWKTILLSRAAYDTLFGLFEGEAEREHTRLPPPSGAIRAERLTVLAPASERAAIAEVSFDVAAGEIIGLVGASGSGKSTLLRALAGAATVARGTVRLDGASIADWDSDELARYLGYMPQSFVVFQGTVKENISRFRGLLDAPSDALDREAIAAATAAGAHEMILRLPQGYDTQIGTGGIGLSAGQAQLVTLARALFGKPRLLLLDEPTAHLDTLGQRAFLKLLATLRSEHTTVLYATHSIDMLAGADKLMVMREGRVERVGPVAEFTPPSRPVSHVPQKAA